jgi:hypothetical protein
VRGQSGGVGAEAVVGVGEEGAPVSGGVVLWLKVEAREVAAVRRQSREGKSQRGGEKLGRRRWGSLFKGAAGGEAAEGGRVSRVTHGGGARESEGGGGRQAWRGNGSVAGSSPQPTGAGGGVAGRQWRAAGSGRRN